MPSIRHANTIRLRSSVWSFCSVPVWKFGSMIASMNGIRNWSLSRIEGTSLYALKISLSSRPSDSTMYWYACVWIASSNAWRSRNWRHSGAVMWRYVPSTMLFAASESAVTKKPRLRLMMRRSSSVRPFGSFQSAMSRDMLTSCGIQWFAHVARYFSHAHLYLNGTSWLTSVLPLMMRLSAAFTRWPSGAALEAACAVDEAVETGAVIGAVAETADCSAG